jgi:hypothetical protein
MRKAGFYFFSAILSVSALVLGAGCSGDGGATSGTGGSGTTTGGDTTTTGGDTTTTTTGGSTTTSTSSGGAMAASCDTYCTAITKNCTGQMAQYTDAAGCKAACADITTLGKPGDKSGASLECHAYHADAAAMDAKLHCPHAGPTGGDKKVSDTMEGACGDGCTSFCEIAMKACSSAKPYPDMAGCTADCRKFKDSAVDYSSAYYAQMANWKDDFGCRMYHLAVASTSADAAKTHCPHIVSTSPVCNK